MTLNKFDQFVQDQVQRLAASGYDEHTLKDFVHPGDYAQDLREQAADAMIRARGLKKAQTFRHIRWAFLQDDVVPVRFQFCYRIKPETFSPNLEALNAWGLNRANSYSLHRPEDLPNAVTAYQTVAPDASKYNKVSDPFITRQPVREVLEEIIAMQFELLEKKGFLNDELKKPFMTQLLQHFKIGMTLPPGEPHAFVVAINERPKRPLSLNTQLAYVFAPDNLELQLLALRSFNNEHNTLFKMDEGIQLPYRTAMQNTLMAARRIEEARHLLDGPIDGPAGGIKHSRK
ncbi:hypothetical protein [Dinghuibacter silviterrae]|uniref:Uncharacterized protein n=1 Tax=Dinghuibacter silviterrae TaxID=1539049 RepID=A0A4R8DIH7_9BACT|nr:hypothetical protein [Dinghuibacter silviterrae]TDW97104.1 hypothetical protein EDB95_4945 [Dinghuibacter silviterrae]